MDFNLSDLQRMLLDSAERFIANRYSLEHRRSLRQTDDGLDAETWASFAELGWLAIVVPEEMGGLGGSMTDVAVLASALGRRCVTEPLVSSAVIAPTILAGAEQDQSGLIEQIIAGSVRIALAHDEPNARYDYRGVRKVSLGADGKLTGQKVLALDAPSATHFIVSASRGNDLMLVLVAADATGISGEAYRLYDGARARDLHFEGVEATVLAQGDAAEGLLALAIDRARVALAAQMVGSMESELDICSAYLKERHQFGVAIGSFQSLQHIMADMFVATHQARSMLYYALSNLDADRATCSRAVALARLNINEAAQLVSRQAIQLHGGYGVTDEYEVSHHYRRQLVLEKTYGDVDFYLRQLAPETNA